MSWDWDIVQAEVEEDLKRRSEFLNSLISINNRSCFTYEDYCAKIQKRLDTILTIEKGIFPKLLCGEKEIPQYCGKGKEGIVTSKDCKVCKHNKDNKRGMP